MQKLLQWEETFGHSTRDVTSSAMWLHIQCTMYGGYTRHSWKNWFENEYPVTGHWAGGMYLCSTYNKYSMYTLHDIVQLNTSWHNLCDSLSCNLYWCFWHGTWITCTQSQGYDLDFIIKLMIYVSTKWMNICIQCWFKTTSLI